MSAWIVITAADLYDYLLEPQATVLRETALADGQADPFTNVMHDRATYVRNRLKGRARVSATAYAVPPELKSQMCLLVLEAMQGRIPMLALEESQRRQIDQAYRDLTAAATEDFPISTPDDPEASAVERDGGGITVVRKPTRVLSRDDMRGL